MNKLAVLLFLISTSFFAQKTHYNTKKGFVAEGYDVVEYFTNKAVKGAKKYTTTFEGARFRFSTKENLETFKNSPKKFIPQYGGYCAYAIGLNGEKVDINPKTFEIRKGKLYLFYNAWGTNTLKRWKDEGAEQLQRKADKNWLQITKE
jgi:YHS domain-containing protein